MAKTSPTAFISQVRAEASKVVWPTRKETLLTTAMVLVLSALVAAFFFVVDLIINWMVTNVIALPLA